VIGRRRRDPGQALVEFTVVVPVFMLLLLGMMEFGFAFSDRLTLGNATREGARVGASLVTGSTTACTGDPNGVDTSLVASMQFILKSGGSDVDLSRINSIKIFKASSTGAQVGSSANVWHYTPGSGPDADTGPGVERLDFSVSSSGWPACNRDNGSGNPDSIGVSIDYLYQLKTPLSAVASLLGFSQASSIDIVDTTVMSLNPTS
jgi:hypothetical protein